MKILLSNDDGYFSLGINILNEVLTAAGHDVYVCAPSEERSGQSHAMSFFRPILASKKSERVYSTTGTPADCVAIALQSLLVDIKFDLVISGINAGLNVGTDVNYSGTVGAATEAALLGYRAIAVSTDLENLNSHNMSPSDAFRSTAQLLARLLPHLSKIEWPTRDVININHPGYTPKGLKVADCGTNNLYLPNIQKMIPTEPRLVGHTVYMLGGSARRTKADASQDVGLILEGFATISMIDSRQSCSETNNVLNHWLNTLGGEITVGEK